MDSLVIPPAPNWYEKSILACTPDNTLIYGTRGDIFVIYGNNADDTSSLKVQTIIRAHYKRVLSVNLNIKWGEPNKYIVTSGDDKMVKVWDFKDMKIKASHNFHAKHSRLVGATFADDQRIISISEEGNIVVWHMNTNNVTNVNLNQFINNKIVVTCLSNCPHLSWLTAVGLENGLVLILDLRKTGKLLFKLRGHDKSVTSFAWCPAPFNIFPKMTNNYQSDKNAASNTDNTVIVIDEAVSPSKVLQNLNDESQILLENEENPHVIPDENLTEDKAKSDENLTEEKAKLDEKLTDDKAKSDENLIEEKAKLDEKLTNGKAKSDENLIEEKAKPDEKLTDETKLDENDSEKHQINVEESSEKVNDCDEGIVQDVEASDSLDDNVNDGQEEVLKHQNSPQTVSLPKEEALRKEFLLASSGSDGKIYIWRAGTDGRMQTFMSVDANKKKKGRNNKTSFEKTWITLYWPTPTALLSSSKTYELIQWTLPKPTDCSKLITTIHNHHTYFLFNIAGPVVIFNKDNWLDPVSFNVWTFGHDNLLINVNLKNKNVLTCFPTICGSITCLDSSPINSSRLLIGTSNCAVKVWNLAIRNNRIIDMVKYQSKIKSKITCVAWHPENEFRFAFATYEGAVGYVDTSNKNQTPRLFGQFFKKSVVKLEWGPLATNTNTFGVFATCEGQLVIFDVEQLDKEPKEISKPDNSYIYTFSWKPDYSMMLVSTKSNSLIRYSTDLKILSVHYYQQKLESIVWHPEAVISKNDVAKYCFYFASVTNSNTVKVFDSKVNEKEILQIEASGNVVHATCWSPFDNNLIVICTDWGVAEVWDINQNCIIATYITDYFEPIFSAIWSPMSADFVILGTRDNLLLVVDIFKHKPMNKQKIQEMRDKTLREVAQISDIPPKEEKVSEVKQVKTKFSVLPKRILGSKDPQSLIKEMQNILSWKEDPSQQLQRENMLDLFGSNEDTINFVKKTEQEHLRNGKYNAEMALSLFRGDIGSSIKKAIEEKRVTPLIISLASMVSPKLAQEACEVYAAELSQDAEADPMEIAIYYLACHQVENAVNVLCEASMYHEALILTKCRMMENDETIKMIIEKWCEHLVVTGNFEPAAIFYIYLGKYADAASILFRRKDVSLLEFAAILAEKGNNEELCSSISLKVNELKMASGDGLDDIPLPNRADVLLMQKDHEVPEVVD